jgi:zinc/manganese transport system permease protein
MAGSVVIALLTVWAGLASSYEMNWPVGFFVGTYSAAWYGIGRLYAAWHRSHAVAWTGAKA